MEKYYQSFIKFGEKIHMEKLFHEGEMHCNTLNHFAEMEYNDNRTDKYDGTDYLIQGKDFKLKLDNKIFATSNKIQIYRRNLDQLGNVYCLYGIENTDLKLTDTFLKMKLDLSSITWGGTAVFIYDTKEFLKRVNEALELKNLKFEI